MILIQFNLSNQKLLPFIVDIESLHGFLQKINALDSKQ